MEAVMAVHTVTIAGGEMAGTVIERRPDATDDKLQLHSKSNGNPPSNTTSKIEC